MAQKGGRKLVRSGKDKGYYQRQYARTAANKARRAARIRRRKVEIAKPTPTPVSD